MARTGGRSFLWSWWCRVVGHDRIIIGVDVYECCRCGGIEIFEHVAWLREQIEQELSNIEAKNLIRSIDNKDAEAGGSKNHIDP